MLTDGHWLGKPLAEPWPPPGVDWYFADEAVAIAHGDCRDVLPLLPQVDAVITDPPYNIGSPQRIMFDNHGKPEQRRLVGQDFGCFDVDSLLPSEWMPRAVDCLKEGGVLVTFYDARNMDKLLTASPRLEVVQDFHWCKPNPPVPMRSVGFSWGVESGYIFRRRGERHRHNNAAGISPNWILCPKSHLRGHPTQKPLKVILWLVNHWSFTDEIVLDPFMGSGTTLRAAKNLGRRAIGVEVEERWCEMAAKRMAQGVLL